MDLSWQCQFSLFVVFTFGRNGTWHLKFMFDVIQYDEVEEKKHLKL